MSKRRIGHKDGIVFSTDPDFKVRDDAAPADAFLQPGEQKLKIRLDKKQRAGKAVTLIEEFVGSDAELEELGKKIKSFCGTGGSVKDGIIIIQGDQVQKVVLWLIKNGFVHSGKG